MKAFLFPGQGSQYVGMSQKIPDVPFKDDLFDIASKIIGFDMYEICEEGPQEKLSSTEITQPALFTISAIYDVLLKQKGIVPDIVAGHSLGEYSALFSAGIVDFEQGFMLVKKRGELMKYASLELPGGMLAVVGLSLSQVDEVINIAKDKGIIVVANYNTPEQFVLSGTKEALDCARDVAKEKGAKLVRSLDVSAAFHSPLMEPIVQEMSDFIDSMNFSPPKLPIVQNVTAQIPKTIDEIKENLKKQMKEPVKWLDSVYEMKKYGVDEYYEVGPKNVLKGLVEKILPEVKVVTSELVFANA